MDRQDISLQKAKTFIKALGGISLVLAPLLSFIGWGISYDTLASFFTFKFSYHASNGASQLMVNPDPALILRYFLLPHYFMYASMPIYIALGLTLMYTTYKKAPWLSFMGALLSIIGGVYFIGVLGAYLSAPIGSVVMTSILKVSFALCMLVFVGNVFLGLSLYKSTITAKWSPLLFIFGNVLILVFPGVENWMALGSFMMLIAMIPITKRIFTKHSYS
jgi:hypothetical protein